MLIVSTVKPTDKTFENLSLEKKSLLRYMEEQRRLDRELGVVSPVLNLIERGRAAEHLIKLVVKRRNRTLFD